jgi:hypothetical protein
MPYQRDKALLSSYAEWLKPVPWQLFCTFTIAWRASDTQAVKIFEEFMLRLEMQLSADVAFIRGDEKRFSGAGKPACPRHFHVLLASAAVLDERIVKRLWMSMAGNRSDGGGADVRPYKQELPGA